MVEKASDPKGVFHHNNPKIHQAVPVSVIFEREQYPDMKGESIAAFREVEEIDFEEEENQTDKEYSVFVEHGEYVAWKIEHTDHDHIITEQIPWSRVIKIQWGFLTFEEEGDE